MRSFAFGVAIIIGCAPHEDDRPDATPPAIEAAPVALPQPEPVILEPPLDSLTQALRDFPEDRQELTLALGSRTHRCCYWGNEVSRIGGLPSVIWVGPALPWIVAPKRNDRTLLILDPHADGWFAFYRQLYGDPGCLAADERGRCTFEAVMFDAAGKELWDLRLDELFSRPGLGIDDLHWHAGTLYFNEGCVIPDTKRCGALVAYDPVAKKVRWRSRPRVSSDAFRFAGDRVVAVFSAPFGTRPGGTAALTVLDRESGRTLARRDVDSLIDEVIVDGDVVMVDARGGTFYVRMTDRRGDLVLEDIERPEDFDPVVRSLYR